MEKGTGFGVICRRNVSGMGKRHVAGHAKGIPPSTIETNSGPTLEEILEEIRETAQPKDAHSASEFAKIFGRSPAWIRNKLVRGGFLEQAGGKANFGRDGHPAGYAGIYRLTEKGKKELARFIIQRGGILTTPKVD
jgi:hypothetical protein